MVFTLQNNHKNLDPSYNMDLDYWDCFGRMDLDFYVFKRKTQPT